MSDFFDGLNFDVMGVDEPERAAIPRFAYLSRVEGKLRREEECAEALRARRKEAGEALENLKSSRALCVCLAVAGWLIAIPSAIVAVLKP